MSQSCRIAFLVPTRHRPSDLTVLLESFVQQTRSPDLVMIIDGGDDGQTVEGFVGRYPNLNISYIRVNPPGLTKQRNAGLDALPKDISFVGFLDDDIELMPDAIEVMMAFWQSASPDFGGASFNIVNNMDNRPTLLKRFFFINGTRGGTVLKSGFNVMLQPVERDTETEWLSGGATVWRSSIFNQHRFEEKYGGYGHFDDLDFCFSLYRTHRMIVLKKAKVLHHDRQVRRDKVRAFGESDVLFRYMFVKRFGLSFLAFYWATFGITLIFILSGIRHMDRSKFEQAFGHIDGLIQIFRGTNTVTAIDIK
jgi:glycosyltransferase involved in cell wall biosynthesis